MLLYCMDCARSSNETLDVLDSWMVCSLTELMYGKYLCHDPWGPEIPHRMAMSGKALAGDWRAVVVVHRGDEKYIQKAYQMQVGWLSH